jgi:hypothetical protein
MVCHGGSLLDYVVSTDDASSVVIPIVVTDVRMLVTPEIQSDSVAQDYDDQGERAEEGCHGDSLVK